MGNLGNLAGVNHTSLHSGLAIPELSSAARGDDGRLHGHRLHDTAFPDAGDGILHRWRQAISYCNGFRRDLCSSSPRLVSLRPTYKIGPTSEQMGAAD